MHDWWMYIVVSSFGEVRFDKSPSVIYRQHERNVVGTEVFIIDKMKKKWLRFKKNKNKRYLYYQALEFYEIYGNLLIGEQRKQLELFLAPRKLIRDKLLYLVRTKLYRQSAIDSLLFRFLVFIGYI
ncbi:hypothetical protein D3C81_1302800 [compost metagenome]